MPELEQVSEVATKSKEALRAERKALREKIAKGNDTDFYLVFVFRDAEEKSACLKALGEVEGDDRFVDGDLLLGKLNLGVEHVEKPKPATHRARQNGARAS